VKRESQNLQQTQLVFDCGVDSKFPAKIKDDSTCVNNARPRISLLYLVRRLPPSGDDFGEPGANLCAYLRVRIRERFKFEAPEDSHSYRCLRRFRQTAV
jgi:hypothetical protein